MGLRERKRNACAALIHQTAVQLVTEKGYDAVTVALIAHTANMSPKTVFNYWGSKDGAILGITNEDIDPVWSKHYLDSDTDDTFVPLIGYFAARTVNQTQRHAQQFTQIIHDQTRLAALHHAHMHRLAEKLAELCAQKIQQLRPTHSSSPPISEARLVVAQALTVVRHAWQEWARTPHPSSFDDHLQVSLDLHHLISSEFLTRSSHLSPSGVSA